MRLNPLVYVRIRKGWIDARLVGRAERWQGPPHIEVGGNERILRIGHEVSRDSQSVVTGERVVRCGFGDNAQTLLDDRDATELILRQILRRLLAPRHVWSGFFRLKPDVVLHLAGTHASVQGADAAAVESLRQMPIRAGARGAYIWTGGELSDADMLRGRFPGGRWIGDAPDWWTDA